MCDYGMRDATSVEFGESMQFRFRKGNLLYTRILTT